LFDFWVNSTASLYAGALRQLTTGLMGCSGLCSLISPFMVGAVGFMFMYFHLVSGGMSVLLLFITFRIWDWKDLVGSCVVVWKLLASIKLKSKDIIPEEISGSHSSAAEVSSLVGCYALLAGTTLAYRREAVPSSSGSSSPSRVLNFLTLKTKVLPSF